MKIFETLANGYSYESAERELSNEYQNDMVSMIFKNLSIYVLWTKVFSFPSIGRVNLPQMMKSAMNTYVVYTSQVRTSIETKAAYDVPIHELTGATEAIEFQYRSCSRAPITRQVALGLNWRDQRQALPIGLCVTHLLWADYQYTARTPNTRSCLKLSIVTH